MAISFISIWKEANSCVNQKFILFCKNATRYLQAFINLSYVIAIGEVKLNLILNGLDCFNCCLYTCLNVSVSIDFTSDTPAKEKTWYLATVDLTRPWEESHGRTHATSATTFPALK